MDTGGCVWGSILASCYHIKSINSQAVVTHTFNAKGRQISEFAASLVYRVSSRIARAIQRKEKPCLGKKTKQNNNNNKKPTKKQNDISLITSDT